MENLQAYFTARLVHCVGDFFVRLHMPEMADLATIGGQAAAHVGADSACHYESNTTFCPRSIKRRHLFKAAFCLF